MSLSTKLKVLRNLYRQRKTLYNIEATKIEWRRRNPHNYVYPDTSLEWPSFPIDKVKVGNYSYGGIKVACYTGKEEGLTIGHFCSIATGTKFLLGGEHPTNHLSTYPFNDKFYSQPEAISKGPIIVEDDVWIGERCLILSGVTLRRGTIVAAGSVVTSSTEPYSIIGGVPAKHIKYRFSNDIIQTLMQIDFSQFTTKTIYDYINRLCKPVTHDNIDEFEDLLK